MQLQVFYLKNCFTNVAFSNIFALLKIKHAIASGGMLRSSIFPLCVPSPFQNSGSTPVVYSQRI